LLLFEDKLGGVILGRSRLGPSIEIKASVEDEGTQGNSLLRMLAYGTIVADRVMTDDGGTNNAFEFEVLSNSLASDMRIQIWTSGSMVSNAIFTMPTTPGVVSVPFSSFTGTGDPTNVQAVFFRTVLRPGAWTYSISFLESIPVELQSFAVE